MRGLAGEAIRRAASEGRGPSRRSRRGRRGRGRTRSHRQEAHSPCLHDVCASRASGGGYVSRSLSITAKEVIRCSSALAVVMMCRTVHPRPASASAINDRWQRQGTASAHMMAVELFSPDAVSFSSAFRKDSVCI